MSIDKHIQALGIKQNSDKAHAYKMTLYSSELGKKYPVVAFSNNSDRAYIVAKYEARQKKRNEAYQRDKANEGQANHITVESKPAPSVLGSQIPRVDFNLILNHGTDTTTIALIGSSFAAGKTTIMMNKIVPFFYGARRKYNKAKNMWKATKQLKVKGVDDKSHLYINTLFSLNTQIKAYKGYTDLIKVTGFEQGPRDMIDRMRECQIKTDNKYRFAIFVDDILDVRHSKVINNLYMTLRNCEISTCMCLQYLYLLSKPVRNNVQNLIFCKLLSDESIEAVIKTYLGSFFKKMGIAKDDMINAYKELTDNFNFIHLHQGTNQIFFCKAVPLY